MIAGVVIGVVYALSPLTVWFTLAMILLVPAAVLPVMTALALVAAQSIGPVIDGGM